MKLEILDSGRAMAEENMAIDHRLLSSLASNSNPILHFYDWVASSITYGYFCAPDKFLCKKGLQKHGIQMARRPTGGGIIFHAFDLAFSFLLPSSHPSFSLNTLENYRCVNEIIAKTIRDFLNSSIQLELLSCQDRCSQGDKSEKDIFKNFCMARPTVYDVVEAGRKLAGGAQRRTKKGFLHQASIALTLPSDEFLNDLLLPESGVANAIRECSFPLLGNQASPAEQSEAKEALQRLLIQNFKSLNG